MRRSDGVTTWCVGAITGASFLLSLHVPHSFLLPFSPFLVLGIVGFACGFKTAVYAALIAGLMVLLFAPAAAAVAFTVLFAAPAVLFLYFIRFRQDCPAGKALCWLSLYAAGIVSAAAFVISEAGGLEAVMQGHFERMLPMLDPRIAPEIERKFLAYPYVFLAVPVHYLVLACYAVLWLAHWLVRLGGGDAGAGIGLARFQPPVALPVALLAAALWSFGGTGQAAFTAKALFLILLLPYFLSGLSLLHRASRDWPGRFFVLLAVYLGIAVSVWVATVLTAVGAADHVRSALKNKE